MICTVEMGKIALCIMRIMRTEFFKMRIMSQRIMNCVMLHLFLKKNIFTILCLHLVKFGLILQSLAMRPLINKKELNVIIVHINCLLLQVIVNNTLKNGTKVSHHVLNEHFQQNQNMNNLQSPQSEISSPLLLLPPLLLYLKQLI